MAEAVPAHHRDSEEDRWRSWEDDDEDGHDWHDSDEVGC